MWKEILETKVIRIEGSDQSDLTTLVYLTDTLAEELNPYNKDKAFEIFCERDVVYGYLEK